MYNKLSVIHYLILLQDSVAYFPDQLLQCTGKIFVNFRPTNSYQNFCNVKFLHFSFWRQYLEFTCAKELFSKVAPIASIQKCALQVCSKCTGGDPYGNVISKNFAQHFCMVLYCKFADDLQNTFLEEHLCGTGSVFISFVLVQVINNTFYWLSFIIYWPEFADWWKTFLKFFFFHFIIYFSK